MGRGEASKLLEGLRQEDCKFKARLGKFVKLSFKIEKWVRGLAQWSLIFPESPSEGLGCGTMIECLPGTH